MNASNLPLLQEVLLGPQPADQPSLELASAGVQRYVWQSAFGAMLIEVRDGVAYVNGGRVTSVHELGPGAVDGTISQQSVAGEGRARVVRA
jgi:hypothetical protein